MSKFKVGAEVRAISESNGWGAIEKGDIGKVKSCGDYGYLSIDFPNQSWWSCREKNVELVEPKAVQDKAKRLLKGANIGAAMIGDALAKSQEAELTTRYGDRYKQYVEVATKQCRTKPTKTPLQLKIEKCEAKLAKLKGRL